ncbi:MAG TPA: DUF3014 domain-containing protein [Woeseiaceae bacterium]|nr:DUF3014 domain-containing protein [Woeseiaceae bacterium]
MRKDVLQWLIPVLLAIALAAALAFYWWQSDRTASDIEPDVRTDPPETVEEAPPVAPDHPLETTGEEAAGQPELRPLPPLEESDEYFSLELSELFGPALSERLIEQNLVERVVATIDNLPREQIAERIKPMSGIGGQLAVNETEEEGEYVIAPENYERYDAIVGMVENADVAEVEELYRRFFPLFQKAYIGLGYPDGYFNDRVIEVIDHLLATPEPGGELILTRPHVLYEFADPELEELSPGQKLLLRMGDEHRATVKERLREFRARIVAE